MCLVMLRKFDFKSGANGAGTAGPTFIKSGNKWATAYNTKNLLPVLLA